MRNTVFHSEQAIYKLHYYSGVLVDLFVQVVFQQYIEGFFSLPFAVSV